jgi:molybdopterin/thiamine biosynthesis adenylyltransferase/rhodanese-related sulfurtransferase
MQLWLYYHPFPEVNMIESTRYQRQILLPGIGIAGQKLLQDAKVLVIGAGGLGCPALQYLVAAGVGTIGIVDGDVVSITNLHRQILFSPADIGKSKALVAAENLEVLNADCKIKPYNFFIDTSNAFGLIGSYDIILDGSDNFSTRYLVNDTCVLLNKPLVYGAVYRFEGHVAVFNYLQVNGKYSAQYRDLFPVPPEQNTIPNCAEAGVLGVLPGIIGTMQANEVIKLVTHIGKPLINTVYTYNALTNQTYQLEFEATAEGRNAGPVNRKAFEAMNYTIDCTITNDQKITSIDAAAFDTLIANNNISIIDVREEGELPLITSFEHRNIPLSVFDENAIAANNDVIFFCQTGIRSRKAAMLYASHISEQNVYNLEDGIVGWLAYKNMPAKTLH